MCYLGKFASTKCRTLQSTVVILYLNIYELFLFGGNSVQGGPSFVSIDALKDVRLAFFNQTKDPPNPVFSQSFISNMWPLPPAVLLKLFIYSILDLNMEVHCSHHE